MPHLSAMADALTNAAEYTVSEIAQAVKRTVEDGFGYVRVRGEISGFRGQHSSGHAYFTLKDTDAAIDAVVWRGNWGKLTFKPEEGLEVIATGRLTTFPRSSKYQIVIEQLEPAGADGFGSALEEGHWVKIPQIGGVRIGDDVEIGANTTIDRGALDDTVIEEGVKLDNQIQVGHNVRIGAHTAIAACTGIAGSAEIGSRCTIGGAAMIHGHIKIADGVHVSAGTLISRSVQKPGTYTGIYPFDEHESWKRSAARLRRLAKGKKDA
jgi:hypothetical protein